MTIDWNHLIRVDDFDFIGLLYLITHRIWRVWFLRFPPSTAKCATTRQRLRTGKSSISFSQMMLLSTHLCCIPGLAIVCRCATAAIILLLTAVPSKLHLLSYLPILHQLLKHHCSTSLLGFVKDLMSHFYLSKDPFDLCLRPTNIWQIKWLQELPLLLGHALFFLSEFHCLACWLIINRIWRNYNKIR